MSEIRDNLEIVRRRIEEACQRAGRDASEVTLIAVSKTKPVPMLEEAYEGGARDFGENKVQEIQAKYGSLPDDVRWHMIGHLQRNKVHQVLGKAVLIHSVPCALPDRLRRRLQKRIWKRIFFWKSMWQKKRANMAFLWKMPRRPYGRSAPSLMCISAD